MCIQAQGDPKIISALQKWNIEKRKAIEIYHLLQFACEVSKFSAIQNFKFNYEVYKQMALLSEKT